MAIISRINYIKEKYYFRTSMLILLKLSFKRKIKYYHGLIFKIYDFYFLIQMFFIAFNSYFLLYQEPQVEINYHYIMDYSRNIATQESKYGVFKEFCGWLLNLLNIPLFFHVNYCWGWERRILNSCKMRVGRRLEIAERKGWKAIN